MCINRIIILLQVAIVFNLFITYGDTFLPNPNVYDELYYELIRMHHVFENLYSLGKHTCVSFPDVLDLYLCVAPAVRHVEEDGVYKDTANRLITSLVNIRAIVNHFTPKIDSWSASHQVASLTPDQASDCLIRITWNL